MLGIETTRLVFKSYLNNSQNSSINTQNSYASRFASPIAASGRDTVSFSKKADNNSLINTYKYGNVIHVSFKGRFNDPVNADSTSLQMKVRGVTNHQHNMFDDSCSNVDDNITRLAQRDWKEGKKITYEIVEPEEKHGVNKKANGKNKHEKEAPSRIELTDPNTGVIGRVPDEIATDLIKLMKGRERDFRFELSNVIAGTTKGASTIGLRVVLKYTGKDQKTKQDVEQTFDSLLNSKDTKVKSEVMLYQPISSPEKVLERIFNVEAKDNGVKSAQEVKEAITSISEQINDPKNKNILIVGHCKPDGDTLGCVIGMETAIKGSFPDKHIDCAVDDKIPGLFREKMPGIEDVKRPFNPERIKTVEKSLDYLRKQEQTPTTKSQIELFEHELNELNDPKNLFDQNPLEGKDPKKYDLVLIMDVPTPKRFTGAFKNYIENAGHVIYIDHHPHRINEWEDAKPVTGVDMNKIHDEHLALVCESVPAATQLVTIVANQAGILGKTMKNNIEEAKKFVASIITGTSTDTGSFTRTANLLPEHAKMPVKQRPNYLPEGMTKWLVDELDKNSDGGIDKKWLRDNITFDIPDRRLSYVANEGEELSPRDKMLTYGIDGREDAPELGVGFISIDYDQMYDVWQDSLKQDEDITLLDIQNGFKYSEIMGALKADSSKLQKKQEKEDEASTKTGKPNKKGKLEYKSPYEMKNQATDKLQETQDDDQSMTLEEKAKYVYDSPFEDDKIAVLIIQDRKKGAITENSEIADQNGLRLSIRSQDASDHAELIASLFGGGGHGGAAGGRVDLPGVELDTPLNVKINGEISSDPAVIYKELKRNYEITHNSNLSPELKRQMSAQIELEKTDEDSGSTTKQLITDLVKEIRKDDKATKDKEEEQQQTKTEKRSNKNNTINMKHHNGKNHKQKRRA